MLLLHTPCPDPLPDRPPLGRLGEGLCTVGEWLAEPAVRPLVRRTRWCCIPLDQEVLPGMPRLWAIRLPSAEAVRRTSHRREGLALRPHWGALAKGRPAASPSALTDPALVYTLARRVCVLIAPGVPSCFLQRRRGNYCFPYFGQLAPLSVKCACQCE